MTKSHYQYSFVFTGIAPGITQNVTKNIQRDADFQWIKGEYFADIAAADETDSTRVIPLCTVYIQDTASSYYLSDAPVALASLFGVGEIPFILPAPYVFVASNTINMQLSNFSAATTYNVRITMTGLKIQGAGGIAPSLAAERNAGQMMGRRG